MKISTRTYRPEKGHRSLTFEFASQRRTRPIRVMHWIASRLYVTGICPGTMWGLGPENLERVGWTFRLGERPYLLGVKWGHWRCLFRFHHWPGEDIGAFGMCGKCAPWPCCAAVTYDHTPGCPEA